MHAQLRTPKKSPIMRAAEGEWLQEPESVDEETKPGTYSNTSSHASRRTGTRFDWKSRLLKRTVKMVAAGGRSTKEVVPYRHKPLSVQVAPGQPFFHEIEAYTQKFGPLLLAEQTEEETALHHRLRTWPLEKLQEDGYCITGLSAFWLDATHFGKPVAVFSLGPGEVLPHHQFSNGTVVLVSRQHPLETEPETIVSSVLSKTSTQLRLVFDLKMAQIEQGQWRIDLGSSGIAFQRMRAALSHLHFNLAELEDQSTTSRQIIFQGTGLRDVLLKTFAPKAETPTAEPSRLSEALADASGASGDDNAAAPLPANISSPSLSGIFSENLLIQSWANRYQAVDPVVVEGDPPLDLNPPQIRAVATMIGERISLIQGPPGTGKTRTIIEAIRLLKKHFGVPLPLLIATYTNVAVDNLVEGLVKAGLNPLRVGFAGRVRPELHPYTLDARIQEHPEYREIEKVKTDIIAAERKLESFQGRLAKAQRASNQTEVERIQSIMNSLSSRVQRLSKVRYAKERTMLHEIVSQADVVCTTSITSACAALNVIDFPVVFVDEASMSTEPATLVPLMKGSQHVALIGDHKQLPPIVTSEEAKSGGLALSLFERLINEGDSPTVMLDRQYRMHPSISKFPSQEFYDTLLLDGTVDGEGQVSNALSPPRSSHLTLDPSTGNYPSAIFLDHAGLESRKDRSLVNDNEAAIVCGIVSDLLLNNPSLSGEDIGIIAPYAAQIKLLDRMLRTDPAYRDYFINSLGRHRALETQNIEVKTVDGFEGREKEIIIFSTVRNNPHGNIGFLADRRRLNVGLTRAKRGLFVVGNMNTLRAGKVGIFRKESSVTQVLPYTDLEGKVWGRFIDYMQAQRSIKQLHGTLLLPNKSVAQAT